MAPRGKQRKRIFYKIGEACKKLDIQPYVLRYWETEFPALNPNKSRSGQRVYGEEELAIIRRIKDLLYEEGYTIAGAKKRLEAELAAGGAEALDDTASQVVKDGVAVAASALDTARAKRIKTLRRGIEHALEQSREILDLLESRPSAG
ncbi:MAG: MerR family transcriptional regulator [Acidobacteriota bacterium]|nr:MerR family transcriptional regulator [Acidobacteriota bacterium]